MRLNPDCIRDILLWVEEESAPRKLIDYPEDLSPLLKDAYSRDELTYHIEQCRMGGLLKTENWDFSQGICIWDLTPSGHSFLANIRNSSNWSAVKGIAAKVGSASLDAIMQIATGVIAAMIQKQL